MTKKKYNYPHFSLINYFQYYLYFIKRWIKTQIYSVKQKEILSPECPICKEIKSKVIYEKSLKIYKCQKCSMMFQYPYRTPSKEVECINKLYSIQAKQVRSSIAQNILERMKKSFGPKLLSFNVLEIGVGLGEFAASMVENNISYRGVEPSLIFYNQAINGPTGLNGKIINSSLEGANLNKDSFDLIVMIDTLEHIPYPIEFLINLKQYLKKTGFIYLAVPNEDWFMLKAQLRSMLKIYSGHPIHPEHVNLFTMTTFKKTLSMAGFDTINLCQLSILSDFDRMRIIFSGNALFLTRIITNFFKLTKLDILFKQGNITAISCK